MKPRPMYVAVKGLFVQNDCLLLLKKKEPDFWDIPGGRIEFGESIEVALLRELGEELPNVKNVSVGKLLGVRKKEDPLKDGTELFLVYYRVFADFPDEITLSIEHGSSKWFSEGDLKSLPHPLNKVYGDLFEKLRAKK